MGDTKPENELTGNPRELSWIPMNVTATADWHDGRPATEADKMIVRLIHADADTYGLVCHQAAHVMARMRDELHRYKEFEARLKAKAVEEEAWNDDGE